MYRILYIRRQYAEPLGEEIEVAGQRYRIVGVIKAGKRVGDQMDYSLYVPLRSLEETNVSLTALVYEARPVQGAGGWSAFQTAAQKLGLGAKIHADEIDPIGGSQLAGQIGAVSAEHLIVCPDEGIASMAKGGTIACLLPATSFYLGATFAPAKKMIEAGVPVAVATDFNPGSTPNLSLQLAMNIACYRYRMTPEETLTAATLNAAAAIGRADRVGTVETGKQADLLLWDADNLNYIFYRYGSNLVKTVVKAGQVVKQN